MSQDDENKDKDKEENQPKKNRSMRGLQQGGGSIKCPRCNMMFDSSEEYRLHITNCKA